MSLFKKSEEERLYEELRKQNRDKKIKEALTWIDQNKEAILGGIAVTVAAVTGVTKIANTIDRHNTHRIELERRRQVYDRSTGAYVDLKRKLNSADLKKVNEMKENGMKTTEALRKLNLLK